MTDYQRIVITRERDQARHWGTELRAGGLSVLELPLLHYESLSVPDDLQMNDFHWILFTSPQAVRAFQSAGLVPGDARLGALGTGTAAALANAGLIDSLDAQAADGLGMARFFIEKIPAPSSILMPGASRRMNEPVQALDEAGFQVRKLALYKTLPVPKADLPLQPFAPGDLIFFCSPSAIEACAAAYAERPPCVAIGQTSGQAARKAGFPTIIAEKPDLESMVLAAGLDLEKSPVKPEMEA